MHSFHKDFVRTKLPEACKQNKGSFHLFDTCKLPLYKSFILLSKNDFPYYHLSYIPSARERIAANLRGSRKSLR